MKEQAAEGSGQYAECFERSGLMVE